MEFSFGENKNYDYSFYDEIINTIKNNCTFYVHWKMMIGFMTI